MESIRERSWPAIVLTPITVSGDKIIVPDARGLHPKQQVQITNGALEQLQLEIKRVIDETTIQVGPSAKFGNDPASVRKGGSIKDITNVPVGYSGGTLSALEQGRTSISSEAIFPAVYAEEPTVALRNVLVDYWGKYYSTDNPLPVQLSDGSINIGTVNAELETQLSHRDNWPDPGDVHDSVRIGSGVANEYLKIYPSGDIDIRSIGRTPEEKLKGDLLCAPDLDRDMTWAEIDGVRKVTQIVFTSASLDVATGDTITLTRVFTYQGMDPFDLIEVKDTLTVV